MAQWTGKLVLPRQRAIPAEPITKHIPSVLVPEHLQHLPVLQSRSHIERAQQHVPDVARKHVQRPHESRQHLGSHTA